MKKSWLIFGFLFSLVFVMGVVSAVETCAVDPNGYLQMTAEGCRCVVNDGSGARTWDPETQSCVLASECRYEPLSRVEDSPACATANPPITGHVAYWWKGTLLCWYLPDNPERFKCSKEGYNYTWGSLKYYFPDSTLPCNHEFKGYEICRALMGDSVCGDYEIEGSEECDDGNMADGDGCSSTCFCESGFSPDGSGGCVADSVNPPTLPCPDNQTIMRLYQENNSHAALWDETDYGVRVCYNEIFGEQYTGANPHACTGTNKVLGLYDVKNAHAEVPILNAYTEDVCYGNLTCRGTTGSCAADERLVARLFSNSNSHVSLGAVSGYDTLICCKSEGGPGVPPGGLPGSSWRNLEGNLISAAQIGDTVLMVTNLSDSLEAGQYVEYEVGSPGQGGILGFFSWIWNLITGGSSDTVTASHYVLDSDGDLTFTAKVMNSDGTSAGIEQASETLTVSASGDNSRPVANLVYSGSGNCPMEINNLFSAGEIPQCINKGDSVSFSSSGTSDEDDLLNVRFDFESGSGDEQYLNFYALAYNGSDSLDVTHTFTKSEYRDVEIRVSEVDSSRGQTRVASIPFFVFEPGINVFAVITNPEDGAVEEQLVTFNASQSFVTNCSTVANPGSFNVDGLNCEFIHFPGNKTYNSDDYSLNVEWRYLYEGGVGFDREGDWKTNYESGEAELGVVEFTHLFSSVRGHRVSLNIEYLEA